jgi:hypothetical protein
MVLSFHIDRGFVGLSFRPNSRTLRGMVIILRLDRYTIYASLNKYSQYHQEALKKNLMFLHASFANFLMDPERSGALIIPIDGVEEEVFHFYLGFSHARCEVNSSAFNRTVIVLRNYLHQLTGSDAERDDETAPEQIDHLNLRKIRLQQY